MLQVTSVLPSSGASGGGWEPLGGEQGERHSEGRGSRRPPWLALAVLTGTADAGQWGLPAAPQVWASSSWILRSTGGSGGPFPLAPQAWPFLALEGLGQSPQ